MKYYKHNTLWKERMIFILGFKREILRVIPPHFYRNVNQNERNQ